MWQANQEEKLSQVILIGDASPNTKKEVKSRRNEHSTVWKWSKYNPPTFYLDELTILQSKKIPVHAFYVAERAKKSFTEIADTTGGKSEMLDIDSANGSETLTNLVNIEVLRNIGGAPHGNDLVNAYKTKYNAL